MKRSGMALKVAESASGGWREREKVESETQSMRENTRAFISGSQTDALERQLWAEDCPHYSKPRNWIQAPI